MLRQSLGFSLLIAMVGTPAVAQVTSDNTVGTAVNSIVTPTVSHTITEGTIRSDGTHATLFHSFDTFSPGTGNITFDLRDANNAINTSAVNVVIGRVTGTSSSFIDGQLSIEQDIGTPVPDLFLINPNGITFGSNASLTLPGSFFASTAESIVFQDGLNFSASNPRTAPLLTISTPTGLQFGSSASVINVQSSSLVVPTQRTLSLTGTGVTVTNGNLTTEQGRIEIGSIASPDLISLTPTSDGFTLGYGDVNAFDDITLNQSSAVNVSGAGAGNLHIQGRTINILDAASLTANTTGTQSGGSIRLVASDSIHSNSIGGVLAQVLGTATGQGADVNISTQDFRLSNGSGIFLDTSSSSDSGNITLNATNVVMTDGSYIYIFIEPGATGHGGDITLNVNELWLRDASQIGSGVFGAGNGSRITVNATSLIDASGETPDGLQTSLITSIIIPGGTGNAGNVAVTTGDLRLRDGAQVFSGTFGEGNAGNINVTTNRIELIGQSQMFGFSSSILASSSQAIPNVTVNAGQGVLRGSSGDINIATNTLHIRDGGTVSSATAGFGNAATILVNANKIEVIGDSSKISSSTTSTIGGNGGQIQLNADRVSVQNGGTISAATLGSGNAGNVGIQSNQLDVRGSSTDGTTASSITSSSEGSGAAGSVNITSGDVVVSERGEISVSGTGLGNAGNLTISADVLRLEEQGLLQAQAASGDQGNIILNASQLLIMRHNSLISTNAINQATGGDISIQTPILAGLENSDIVANAVFGNGGQINITTQGIIGLEFRNQLTPENDITASSEFGISGTVDINNFGARPDSGLIELSERLVEASNQVTQGCASGSGNEFIATGRGGIPADPTVSSGRGNTWADTRNLSYMTPTSVDSRPTPRSPTLALTEAITWHTNADGQIELVAADIAQPQLHVLATCSGRSAV